MTNKAEAISTTFIYYPQSYADQPKKR